MKYLLVSMVTAAMVFLLSGCGVTDQAMQDRAITSCRKECEARKTIDDFSSGPCLSNEVQPDWVCDIAHYPRQAVDDQADNQCSAFRSGTAHHFVEFDPDCKLIRAQ